MQSVSKTEVNIHKTNFETKKSTKWQQKTPIRKLHMTRKQNEHIWRTDYLQWYKFVKTGKLSSFRRAKYCHYTYFIFSLRIFSLGAWEMNILALRNEGVFFALRWVILIPCRGIYESYFFMCDKNFQRT